MPPTYSVGLLSSSAWTPLKSSKPEFDTPPVNAVSVPSARLNSAKCPRAVPLAVENSPPAKTVFAESASARTVPSVDGAQFGSTVRSASTWARSVRATPPTDLESPPRYQPPAPSASTALTTPSTSGHGFSSPVEASNNADEPVYGAIRVKFPPMYAVDPEFAMALTSPSGTHVETGAVTGSAAARAGVAARAMTTTITVRRRALTWPRSSHARRESAIGQCTA